MKCAALLLLVLTLLIISPVLATEATFSPINSGSSTNFTAAGTTYSAIRNGAGNGNYTGNVVTYIQARSAPANAFRYLWRSELIFNTSAIPNDATINSVDLVIHPKSDQPILTLLGTPDYVVTGYTPYIDSIISNGDYERFIDTDYSNRIGVASFSNTSYKAFNFTAAGKTAINKTGITPIMIRDSWDRDNSFTGTWIAITAGNQIAWDVTTNTPYLVVNYTSAATPTPTPTPSTTITPSPPTDGAQWCGLQDIWYQHQYSSDIAGYEEWQNYPSGNAEVDENVTVTASDGWVLIDSYITPAGLPNVNVVQPGLRTYHLFGYVDNTTGTTKLNTTLFKRNISGGETFIYAVETDSIESTTVQDNVIAFASPVNLTLDATDRFVSKIYANTSSAASIKVHFVYQGTAHASYVRSGYFVCPDVCCVPTTPAYVPTIPNLPAVPPNITIMDILYGWWWVIAIALLVLWLGRR